MYERYFLKAQLHRVKTSNARRAVNWLPYEKLFAPAKGGVLAGIKDQAISNKEALILGATSAGALGAGSYARKRDPRSEFGKTLSTAGALGLAAAVGLGSAGRGAKTYRTQRELGRRSGMSAHYGGNSPRTGLSLERERVRPDRWAEFSGNNKAAKQNVRGLVWGVTLSPSQALRLNLGVPIAAAGAVTAGGGLVADKLGYEDVGNVAKSIGGLAIAGGMGRTAGKGLTSRHYAVDGLRGRAGARQYVRGVAEGREAARWAEATGKV